MRKNSMAQLICPNCSTDYVNSVGRQGIIERLLSIFCVYLRCQICGYRFRSWRWGGKYKRSEEDRREYERLPCNFSVSIGGDNLHGVGSVVDLSVGGCSLHTETPLLEGTTLRLALQISTDLLPLTVEAAIVRSVHGNRVGVEFIRIQQSERERLQLFVRGLLSARND